MLSSSKTGRDKEKICAIILNYFGYEDTKHCVESLNNEEIPIIIVDNSAEKNEFSKLTHTFKDQKHIRVISPGTNLGFAKGVNFALRWAISKDYNLFLLLNNDTILPHGALTSLKNFLSTTKRDIVAPKIYCYPDEGKLWSSGNYYNRYFGFIFQESIKSLPGQVFYLTGCCLLIKKRVFEKIGFFDEDFFMYGEDIDFCWRAKMSGFKLSVDPKTIIFHKASTSTKSNPLFYEHQMVKAHFLLSKKLIDSRAKVFLSYILKSFVLLVRAIIRTIRYRNFNAIKALISYFAMYE